jgi:hypothetical protein
MKSSQKGFGTCCRKNPGFKKKMFGGIGFLVNGNMACGILNDDLIVRMDMMMP